MSTTAKTDGSLRPTTIIRRVALAVAALGLVWVAFALFGRQPANQREWEYGMETLPSISTRGSTV